MENSVPMVVEVDDIPNVPYLVRRRAELAPDEVSYAVLRDKVYHDVTTTTFLADVVAVAKGLIAKGVQPGDHVAIMSATRYEWTVCDFAIMFAGAVVVPIYETSSEDQTAFILRDSGAVLAFGETARHTKLLQAAAEQNGGTLRHGVWRLTEGGSPALEELKAAGVEVTDEQLRERETLATPDAIASLVYTSGTVSDPRGAAITHRNLAHLAVNAVEHLPEIFHPGAATVLMLPLAHILARFVQLAFYWGGVRLTHLRDTSRVVPVIEAAQPNVVVVVPRVLAKILSAVRKGAEAKKLGKVFDRAQKVAIAWGRHLEQQDDGGAGRVSLGLRAQHVLFDKLFYSRLRTTLGGRLEFVVSGAAPLDPDLSLFFRGAGIQVLEGYGLTETTAPVSVNRPHRVLTGSVGTPIPGTSVRISADGEIEAKGLGVFAGYHHHEARDSDFTADGFFRTGDLGRIDEHGRLHITGRGKDLIVTDSGKNISPQRWQGVVERSDLVDAAVVVGDRRPHPVALLVLDLPALKAWAEDNDRRDLVRLAENPPTVPGEVVTDEALRAVTDDLVREANKGGNHAERIDEYALVVADVSEAAGFTTPTMKLKRPKFIEAMSPVVEDLYAKKK